VNCECGGKTQTKDTRKIEQGIWRRRKCVTCGAEFTTLEQRCETVRTPYTSKRSGDKRDALVVAPDVAKVVAPRARAATRKPTPLRKLEAACDMIAAQPKPAPKVRRAPPPASIPPRTDKTYPAPQQVNRNEPTARDRIEDMKAERKNSDYGWDE
jgi:hypothetical protein